MNRVKQRLADFPKLSVNDDLKIDWDEKHLVLFHFFRGEGESCTIRLWDIEDEPRFLYQVDKGIECITDKVSVHNGHVVMVPSWPLEAQAMVMTLDINNQMAETGKYLFSDNSSQVKCCSCPSYLSCCKSRQRWTIIGNIHNSVWSAARC